MLDAEGLVKRYAGTVALDGLSLTAEPGRMVGFVGPNGAGKTTAMRIILGVLAADAGTVRWRGRPADEAVRRTFGYLPEERGLYPKMRCRDQLVYLGRLHGVPAPAAAAAADRWLAELGLSDRATDRLEALSLGNQQRVQLAAALVHEPGLLILDEPFSGLDPVGVDVLAAVLRARVDAGAAVVFSSHQLELVERLCDTVTIVSRGRLVATGPVAELRAAGGRGRRYRLEVSGAPAGWAAAVPGAAVLSDTAAGTVVELAPAADEQALLDAARTAGRLRLFAPVQPSLAEVFRDAVAS